MGVRAGQHRQTPLSRNLPSKEIEVNREGERYIKGFIFNGGDFSI